MQKTTTWIGLQAEQIFSVNIYTYFSILGVAFLVPFLCFFPKAPSFSCKKIFMSSKSVSQIFKILFQTGDINIFALRGVFFSRYVQLKSSFYDEKNSGDI